MEVSGDVLDDGWSPPRGPRDEAGNWSHTLRSRPLPATATTAAARIELTAVRYYRELIAQVQSERAVRGLSVRSLAAAAGLPASVTNDALTGSTWPRWPSLEALAAALGGRLETSRDPGEPVIEALLRADARGPDWMATILGRRPVTSGRKSAQRLNIRPNTYYNLRRSGHAPSSATVLALAAVNERAIRLAGTGPPGWS